VHGDRKTSLPASTAGRAEPVQPDFTPEAFRCGTLQYRVAAYNWKRQYGCSHEFSVRAIEQLAEYKSVIPYALVNPAGQCFGDRFVGYRCSVGARIL